MVLEVTVTEQESVATVEPELFLTAAVMVAEPLATAVITPLLLTVATEVLLLDQLTLPPVGRFETLSVCVLPTGRETELLLSFGSAAELTVTWQVRRLEEEPLRMVAVRVAVPAASASSWQPESELDLMPAIAGRSTDQLISAPSGTSRSVTEAVLPTFRSREAGLSEGAGLTTVTEQDALWPLESLAVMMARPMPLAVTRPSEETVATLRLSLLQVTLLSAGVTLAVSCQVLSRSRVREVLLREMEVSPVTVTSHSALKPPSWVVTVTVASPADLAVIRPPSTVTTVGSLERQVSAWLVALSGETSAVSVARSPTDSVMARGERSTLSTATGAVTVTSHSAVKPPSRVVTVMVASPADLAVTTPFWLTEATVSSSVDQSTR